MSHVIDSQKRIEDSTEPNCGETSPEPSPEILNAHRTYLLKVAGDLLRPELRPKVSPSDLVQESIVIAIRKFQSFHGSSPQQLRAWLEAILRRRYCNLQRVFYRNARHAVSREVSIDAARSDQPGWELPEPQPDESKNVRQKQLESIREEVRNLTPAEAEVFVLRMEHDFSVAAIAERLAISEACVHKRYQRAVKHLYERLHESVDADSDLS